MTKHRRSDPQIDPRYASFELRVGRSEIHHFGVFASVRIPRGRKVIEFTGKRILRREFESRVRRMSAKARAALIHLGWLSSRYVVDGDIGGSGAEFINHSCEPNLSMRRIHGHMIYFSRRPIRRNEELTATLRASAKGFQAPCHCRSSRCTGFFGSA